MSIEYLTNNLEKVEYLKNLLKLCATGEKADNNEYQELINDLLTDSKILKRAPFCIKVNPSLNSFEKFIKNKLPNYRTRRKFIDDEFQNLIDYIEEDKSSIKIKSVSSEPVSKMPDFLFSQSAPENKIQPSEKTNKTDNLEYTKIFISHSSEDKELVTSFVDLLEAIGIKSDKIFCTSVEGYGIDLGENFLEKIKNELNSNVLVLFILSNNFYKSPICLCEMGATWVKTNKHIPILDPFFDFSQIEGVIPLSQGLKINNPESLTNLKEELEKYFKLNSIPSVTWERKKNKFVTNLSNLYSKNKGERRIL